MAAVTFLRSILWSALSFICVYFADRGAEVNSETREGVTPLHDAVERGDLEIVELLLKNNASPLIKAEKG